MTKEEFITADFQDYSINEKFRHDAHVAKIRQVSPEVRHIDDLIKNSYEGLNDASTQS